MAELDFRGGSLVTQVLESSTPRVQAADQAIDIATSAALPSVKATRLPALDFTKGVLVLIMVLYHWINYFVGIDWPYYRYLRFLTPSFIFVTGFLIAKVYLSRVSQNAGVSKRLIVRAGKLLALFVVLNLGRSLLASLSLHGI